MRIMGLLGMYFYAVVVEVFTFFHIGSGHTVAAATTAQPAAGITLAV